MVGGRLRRETNLARHNLLRLAREAAAVFALVALCTVPAFAGSTDQIAANASTTTVSAASGPIGPAEVAQGNPFADVPPNSWAYQAIRSLASEGLIEGYPDGKFKGNRPMTRYEAAVLINRAVDKLEADIAAGQKANAADIANLKKLVDQFGPELKAVQDHLAALDTKVGALSTQVAANTTTLKRQQFHLYAFFRAPGDFRESASAFNGPSNISSANAGQTLNVPANGALPSNTKVVYGNSLGSPGGVAPQNDSFSGQNTYGTAYEVTRMIFSGDVDPNVSYYVRLEDRYYLEGPNNGDPVFPTGNAFSNPAYCTSLAVCNPNADYPANAAFRLNIAALTYHTPGGFAITAGRILPLESNSDLGGQLLGLSYADYFNGAQLGYHGHGLAAEAGYGFGNPAAQAPGGIQPQQQMWAHADFDFIPHHLNLGGSYISELGNNVILWDPAAPLRYSAALPILNAATGTQVTGSYCGINTGAANTTTGCPTFLGTPMTYGSVYGTYRFSDNLRIQAEFGHHFGNDPFTGSTWQQPNAMWAVATIGNNAGPKGTGWAEVGYIGSGFNGVSPETDITGTTFYSQLYLANPGGYQIWYGGLHYHIANNAEVAVILQHMQLLPGIDLPAGSNACPGCFISQDKKDSIFLQSLIAF
jgi:hypothetical protein